MLSSSRITEYLFEQNRAITNPMATPIIIPTMNSLIFIELMRVFEFHSDFLASHGFKVWINVKWSPNFVGVMGWAADYHTAKFIGWN